MYVFQCDTPEQLRADIVKLIRSTVEAQSRAARFSKRQKDAFAHHHAASELRQLADVIENAIMHRMEGH